MPVPASSWRRSGRHRSNKNAASVSKGVVTLLLFLLLLLSQRVAPRIAAEIDTTIPQQDGPANLREGRRLFQIGDYDKAAVHYWRAVLSHAESSKGPDGGVLYTVEDAFHPFIKCYSIQGRTVDAFLYIARESMVRGQLDMSRVYVTQALAVQPGNAEALEMQEVLNSGNTQDLIQRVREKAMEAHERETNSDQGVAIDGDRTRDEKEAERLYNLGTEYFNNKDFALAASTFEESCTKAAGHMKYDGACANAVYCRSNILDWGYNGTQFVKDMETINAIIKKEVISWRSVDSETGVILWKKASSVHPHMMLGYPVDPMLKRYAAESLAVMDEVMARYDSKANYVKKLPPGLPYNQKDRRSDFVLDAVDRNFKIKVAFVASGFNSKAVLYLSHDMFRFFDTKRFEIHVFSIGAPDAANFIKFAMRGVDWRERVKANVDYFHDVQYLKDDHIALARKIHDIKIHVLIEWDGYARQGLRAQGLFALKPAPIQILHQEFLGTTGGQYVDYIVTDEVTSPRRLENLYLEKFLYMPNHFFSKGHAVQAEVKDPTYDFAPKQKPYVLGTGTPQENRCLSPDNVGPEKVSFVYCNFNKFLKNNPETVLSWINVLRNVPNSILCLLENPASGIPYLRKFVNEVTSSSGLNDGKEINERIHFLEWQANPFDHQMRSQDFCNVVLDSYPYNGHTTAQDSLYGGVPIVTRSDGDDMSSRVTTSANIVLGLEELNAVDGPAQYEQIAIKLGNNKDYFHSIRTRLIDTCLQRNPMHPYWDVSRYVRNLEKGIKMAWDRYLLGKETDHLYVVEDEKMKKGSHGEDISSIDAKKKSAKHGEEF